MFSRKLVSVRELNEQHQNLIKSLGTRFDAPNYNIRDHELPVKGSSKTLFYHVVKTNTEIVLTKDILDWEANHEVNEASDVSSQVQTIQTERTTTTYKPILTDRGSPQRYRSGDQEQASAHRIKTEDNEILKNKTSPSPGLANPSMDFTSSRNRDAKRKANPS